ncbi:hypothetical protein ACFLT9_00350 [Acidobacteriota bacterium]
MLKNIRRNKGIGNHRFLRYFLLIPAAFFFLSASTIGHPSPSPQKFAMVFSPTVGESFRYMLHISFQTEGKDFSGKDISTDANAVGQLTFDVKRSLKNRVSLAITTPGIRVNTESPGESEFYSLMTHENMAVQAAFDSKGAVSQVHNLEALNRTSIWNIPFGHILRDYLPTLPEHPVAPGETWRDHRTAIIPFEEMDLEIEIERQYRLEQIIPSDAGDEAVISITYQVSLSGSKIWGNWSGAIEGQGQGEGTFLYSIKKSCIQNFSADYETAANLTIKNQEKILSKLPFHLTISVSLSQLK